MTDYVPPDPSVGEFVHRKNEEIRQCEQQIKHLNDQELKELVRDRKQPSNLRAVALLQLVPRRGRKESLTERLGEFLDHPDPAVAAIALFHCPLTDERGVDFLKTVANRAQGQLSVVAATWLYDRYNPDVGLKLMLHILDDGDGEAKRGMVQQIPAHLPHAFTADGIHEARLWVQQKLSKA